MSVVSGADGFRCWRFALAVVPFLALMSAGEVPAQQQAPGAELAPSSDEAAVSRASPSAQPPAASPAAPAEGGFVDKLGDLIKGSVDSMSSTLKDTQQSLQDLNKGTVDTLTRLPVAGFAVGRSLCARAENGVPDCRAASETLCQQKGYRRGRSLEIQSAEKCNPRVLIPGYQRKEGDCRTDNFVTRAACN